MSYQTRLAERLCFAAAACSAAWGFTRFGIFSPDSPFGLLTAVLFYGACLQICARSVSWTIFLSAAAGAVIVMAQALPLLAASAFAALFLLLISQGPSRLLSLASARTLLVSVLAVVAFFWAYSAGTVAAAWCFLLLWATVPEGSLRKEKPRQNPHSAVLNSSAEDDFDRAFAVAQRAIAALRSGAH